MGDLEEALAILTAIDLLVLYQTRNGYVFKLVQPLSREAFGQSHLPPFVRKRNR